MVYTNHENNIPVSIYLSAMLKELGWAPRRNKFLTLLAPFHFIIGTVEMCTVK
jgi:hypothetical protein